MLILQRALQMLTHDFANIQLPGLQAHTKKPGLSLLASYLCLTESNTVLIAKTLQIVYLCYLTCAALCYRSLLQRPSHFWCLQGRATQTWWVEGDLLSIVTQHY